MFAGRGRGAAAAVLLLLFSASAIFSADAAVSCLKIPKPYVTQPGYGTGSGFSEYFAALHT